MVTKFGGQILATKFCFVPDCLRATSLTCLMVVNVYGADFFVMFVSVKTDIIKTIKSYSGDPL